MIIMKSPFTGKEMKMTYENSTWKFRGEVYEYVRASWLCTDTGERFTTDELDDTGYLQVTNQYRAKYGIPYVDEIVEIRSRYGLSAAKMASILGFGTNQWRAYEDGEVPSVSNGRMIRSIMDPSVFLTILHSARHVLSDNDFRKINSKVESLMTTDRGEKLALYDQKRLFVCERGRGNGYGAISVEKLKSVVLAVLDQCGEVFCTKMNKLLFYIDFVSYRRYGISVTGLSYRALPYGPVPERWDRIYSCFDEIVLEPRSVGGREGLAIVPVENSGVSLLSSNQLEVISLVCERFKDCSAADISRVSHQEDAWLDCQAERLRIPYEYAFSLKAV